MSAPENTSPLRLHPLTYLEENGEVVVGRTDVDSYGVFPPDGAALLRRLADGMHPVDAAAWYASSYGETVNMAEFLGVLNELGFIADGDADRRPGPPRWQWLGRLLFSPGAWCAYVALGSIAVVTVVLHPQLLPRTGNLFFTHYVTVLVATLFFGQFPLILLHEAFHALAGRRLGLHTRLRLSRRLFFVVFETSVDGLVVFPRRQRYLPILAGMLADAVVVAGLTLAAAATLRADGTLPLAGRICLAMAFTTVLRMCWQFYLYLRTDLYYLAVTALECQDLHAAAKRLFGNRMRALAGWAPLSLDGYAPRDLRVARWYSWLMGAGYAFSIGALILVGLPVLWWSTSTALARFGHQSSWHGLLDSVLFVVLIYGQFVLAGYLALRALRRRQKPSYLTS